MKRTATSALALFLLAAPAFANDGVLDVVAPFEIKGADPIQSGNIFLKMDVTETLVDADKTGKLLPNLATAWTVSEDGLTWTFELQKDVVFHDGSKMDAAAVAASLERSRTNGGLLAKAPIAAIGTSGDAVEITLETAFATLPAMLAEYRSAIIAPSSFGEDGAVTELVGTGPYAVTAFNAPTKLEVAAFDGYWGEAAKIGQAVYHAASRAETRALMAESGDADVTLYLDPASVTRLDGAKGLELASEAIPRVMVLKVNGEVFDQATRKALSLAIDRAGIAKAVLRFPAAATQMFPTGMAEWHDSDLPALDFDPEAAKTALADAGWTAGADGILEKDGKRLEIEILTFPDRPELPLVAAVLEQQFGAVGALATINSTNYSEIPARHQDGTLSTALFARNFGLVPNPVGTIIQDFAPTGDWGAMGWSNDEFTAGANALAAGTAPEGTREELVATLHAELPVLPIAWYQYTAAISDAVEGVVIDPFERTLGLSEINWAE